MSHFLFVLLVLNHLGMCDQHQIVVFHQSCSFSGRRDVSRIIETLFRFPFTSHDHFILPMIHHETRLRISSAETPDLNNWVGISSGSFFSASVFSLEASCLC